MNFKVIRNIIIVICLVVIAYEVAMIGINKMEYKEAADEYQDLENIAVTYVPKEDAPEIIDYPLLNVDFDKLSRINGDIVAWIYFPCLDISYPVVKENEIDEYLYLTFDKNENKAGCIFEDVLSDAKFCGFHDIVFGHNMKDGSMFGRLKQLYQKDGAALLEEDPYVYVYTKDYVYQYRVFAYAITGVGSDAYSVVNSTEEYKAFTDYVKTHSSYPIPDGIDLTQGNSILTLSTCSGAAGSNKRFVVHTIKVSAWEMNG